MATTVTFKTEREFLTAIVKGDFGTEFTDFAKARIAALDKKNAQRKVSKSALAHKAENDGFKSAILAALADGTTKKASDLATALNVSTQKISALAKQLADSGVITVSDVKVKGKGTVKGYTLVTAEDGETSPTK
jgi:type II secretory pathway predicted ATPase ExeA